LSNFFAKTEGAGKLERTRCSALGADGSFYLNNALSQFMHCYVTKCRFQATLADHSTGGRMKTQTYEYFT